MWTKLFIQRIPIYFTLWQNSIINVWCLSDLWEYCQYWQVLMVLQSFRSLQFHVDLGNLTEEQYNNKPIKSTVSPLLWCYGGSNRPLLYIYYKSTRLPFICLTPQNSTIDTLRVIVFVVTSFFYIVIVA